MNSNLNLRIFPEANGKEKHYLNFPFISFQKYLAEWSGKSKIPIVTKLGYLI